MYNHIACCNVEVNTKATTKSNEVVDMFMLLCSENQHIPKCMLMRKRMRKVLMVAF